MRSRKSLVSNVAGALDRLIRTLASIGEWPSRGAGSRPNVSAGNRWSLRAQQAGAAAVGQQSRTRLGSKSENRGDAGW
jgi:hypothetical protein